MSPYFTIISYRPDKTWDLLPNMATAFIDMPTGSVSIYVPSLKIHVNFSPYMTIQSEFQFDNLSHTFSGSVRYRWEYSPGSAFFAALAENAQIKERLLAPHYTSQTSQAVVRIRHMSGY